MAELALATGDIQDCFHRHRMPEFLSPYFCLPGIPADKVPCGAEWVGPRGGDVAYPCAACHPMGFSWSRFLVQRAGEQRCGRMLPSSQRLFGAGLPAVIKLGSRDFDEL